MNEQGAIRLFSKLRLREVDAALYLWVSYGPVLQLDGTGKRLGLLFSFNDSYCRHCPVVGGGVNGSQVSNLYCLLGVSSV